VFRVGGLALKVRVVGFRLSGVVCDCWGVCAVDRLDQGCWVSFMDGRIVTDEWANSAINQISVGTSAVYSRRW
jgi:hypothetical protein